MEKILGIILEFLKTASFLTVSQLLSVFGLYFVFGTLLHLFARSTRRMYSKTTGSWLDMAATGWIGTPVHEVGHAIFCLLFFHKIEKIKLYEPRPKDGSLGYVKHSYNTKNPYHRIGNFFIGIGPIIFGAVTIYLAMYYLVPGIRQSFSQIEFYGAQLASADLTNINLISDILKNSVLTIFKSIVSPVNYGSWLFWLFLYFSIAISSHMELSYSDIKITINGFLIIFLILFIINAIIILSGNMLNTDIGTWVISKTGIRHWLEQVMRFTGVSIALFMFATLLSMANVVLTWLILQTVNIFRGKGMLSPF